ncbi:hypothetical protein JCM12298_29220 [Desulfothermus naphthae]
MGNNFEAIPFTTLLNLLGFDVYAFNLQRASKIISYLAESPYLIRCILEIGFLGLLLVTEVLLQTIRKER